MEKEYFSIYEKKYIITYFSHPLTTKIDYLRHPNLTPIDSVQELNGGSFVPYNQYVRAIQNESLHIQRISYEKRVHPKYTGDFSICQIVYTQYPIAT